MTRCATNGRNQCCFYCMPEEGITYVDKHDLLSYEEMTRLVQLLVDMGIDKVRITGGEPFVRRDMMDFLRHISQIPGLRQINITTNGTTTAPLVPELKAIGIKSVNLSMGYLRSQSFF